MAEPVDRLELVADGEDLGVLGMSDEVDELALQTIRVLELVDHDGAKAELRRLADLAIVAKQVAGGQLEVFEVHDRLATLGGGVRDTEPLEQLLEKLTVVRGQLLESRALGRLPRQLVRRRARTLAGERREIDEALGRRSFAEHVKELAGVTALSRGRRRVGGQRLPLGDQPRHRVTRVRPLAELEDEVTSGRAKRLVHARQHPAQALRTVRRQQAETLGLAPGAEFLERAIERLATEHRGAGVLELSETRIEPGGERMCAEQPCTEAVDRGDPGSVELAREIGAPALAKRRADPRA